MKRELKGNLIILLTAMVWGMGFVAQKAGAELGPFTYNGLRMTLAGLFLIPIIVVLQNKRKGTSGEKTIEGVDTSQKTSVTTSVRGGICCGIVLCFGANLCR